MASLEPDAPLGEPSIDALRALAAWVPRLERADLAIGEWVAEKPDANGVIQMPWFRYGPDVDEFRATLGVHGWIVSFAWPAWLATPRGRQLSTDVAAVATASALELRQLLISIVRSDRFSEGSIAGAFDSGLVLAIARRAAALVKGSERA